MSSARIEKDMRAVLRSGGRWRVLTQAERAALDRAATAMSDIVTGRQEGRTIWVQLAGDLRIVVDDFWRAGDHSGGEAGR